MKLTVHGTFGLHGQHVLSRVEMDNDGVLEFVSSPHPPMVVEGVSVGPASLLDASTDSVQVPVELDILTMFNRCKSRLIVVLTSFCHEIRHTKIRRKRTQLTKR